MVCLSNHKSITHHSINISYLLYNLQTLSSRFRVIHLSMKGCLVLPSSLLRRHSMASRQGYRPLTEDGYRDLDRQVMVVVGREKREFLVDSFVLNENPFRVLMDTMKTDIVKVEDGGKVILLGVDAILFEHMLWLMNNDCYSLLQLNVEEIIDFYSQDD